MKSYWKVSAALLVVHRWILKLFYLARVDPPFAEQLIQLVDQYWHEYHYSECFELLESFQGFLFLKSKNGGREDKRGVKAYHKRLFFFFFFFPPLSASFPLSVVKVRTTTDEIFYLDQTFCKKVFFERFQDSLPYPRLTFVHEEFQKKLGIITDFSPKAIRLCLEYFSEHKAGAPETWRFVYNYLAEAQQNYKLEGVTSKAPLLHVPGDQVSFLLLFFFSFLFFFPLSIVRSLTYFS